MAGIYSAFTLYLVKVARAELWEDGHRPGKHYAVFCKGFEYLQNLVFSGDWNQGPQKPPEEDTYSQHPIKYMFTSPFPPTSNSLPG